MVIFLVEPVTLEAIKFNHNENSASSDALNIVKNYNQPISAPEWRRNACFNAEDSLAAYAIEEIQENTLTIQIQCRTTDPSIHAVEIKAVDPTREYYRRGGGCLYWFLTEILGAKVDPPPPTNYNILGEVKTKRLEFSDGLSNFETFELENIRINKSTGVGIHKNCWEWLYRNPNLPSPNDNWRWLATNYANRTYHRIYTTVKNPALPWGQTPGREPWTDILEYACRWANGASTDEMAARKITRAVYNLGPDVLEYDCPGGGYSWYSAGSVFDCTSFIDLLKGGIGMGRYINCSDCATIVSTFANILGCSLWQSRMGHTSHVFYLNPIKSLGANVWYPGCDPNEFPGWGGFFGYHEVAWTGNCLANDHVYDACLAVDGDADPTSQPHTELLPIRMKFGDVGDGDYRDRLAAPGSRSYCNPRPDSRQRRQVR